MLEEGAFGWKPAPWLEASTGLQSAAFLASILLGHLRLGDMPRGGGSHYGTRTTHVAGSLLTYEYPPYVCLYAFEKLICFSLRISLPKGFRHSK